MKRKMILPILLSLLLAGCTAPKLPSSEPQSSAASYTQITQEEAKRMMARDDGHVIVDVRRQDEYDSGHIPGAILIPNEDIDRTPPAALPDQGQIILIYCRSGRRSKEAAQKLADMGYTNVFEFGGILTWDGEITAAEDNAMKTAKLSFDSFDGGGPSFEAILADPDLVSVQKSIEYNDPNHAEMEGSAFSVRFTFTGLRAGSSSLTIEERSPIAGNYDRSYTVTVDEALRVTIEALNVVDLDAPEPVQPVPVLGIAVADKTFFAALEDNASAAAFAELLSQEPLALELHDYGGFEKLGDLPWELPRSDEQITAAPGDVILYQGKQLTIYYGENNWELTRLARIDNVTQEELLAALGPDNVTVTLWIEWSE